MRDKERERERVKKMWTVEFHEKYQFLLFRSITFCAKTVLKFTKRVETVVMATQLLINGLSCFSCLILLVSVLF